MINWRVRLRNRLWVTSFISQLFILGQFLLVGAHSLGWTDFHLTKEIEAWILGLVNAIFMFLSTLGVIQDPTTKGLMDSERARNYIDPK